MSQIPDEEPRDFGGPPKKRPRIWLWALVAFGILGLLVALLLPAVQTRSGRRPRCTSNLNQIGIALQTYYSAHKAFPPSYTVDADGKPLHSWRTLILPYLDEIALYRSIDLTKPWDDPVNAAAYREIVWAYCCPELGKADRAANHTTYLAVVTPNSFLQPSVPRREAEILDGLSQTLAVIEVAPAQSVAWMSPTDADEALFMSLGPGSTVAHGSGTEGAGMNALYCDGSVHFMRATLPAEDRRALISIAGGESVDPSEN